MGVAAASQRFFLSMIVFALGAALFARPASAAIPEPNVAPATAAVASVAAPAPVSAPTVATPAAPPSPPIAQTATAAAQSVPATVQSAPATVQAAPATVQAAPATVQAAAAPVTNRVAAATSAAPATVREVTEAAAPAVDAATAAVTTVAAATRTRDAVVATVRDSASGGDAGRAATTGTAPTSWTAATPGESRPTAASATLPIAVGDAPTGHPISRTAAGDARRTQPLHSSVLAATWSPLATGGPWRTATPRDDAPAHDPVPPRPLSAALTSAFAGSSGGGSSVGLLALLSSFLLAITSLGRRFRPTPELLWSPAYVALRERPG